MVPPPEEAVDPRRTGFVLHSASLVDKSGIITPTDSRRALYDGVHRLTGRRGTKRRARRFDLAALYLPQIFLYSSL